MIKIKVLLADDHTLVRQGLRKLLEAEADITVVGEAETGREALRMVKKLVPDVVVIDIAMPCLNGLEATRLIVKDAPRTRVLVLSSYNDDDYVHELTQAGAAGYLLKQTTSGELIEAIRQVKNGNVYFSQAILQRILQNYRQAFLRGLPAGMDSVLLTSRELEVVQLIAEGKATKQMAPELGISNKTIEKHRQRAMNKLNIHDIAGITRYAISKGLIAGGLGPLSAQIQAGRGATPPPQVIERLVATQAQDCR